MDTHNAPSLKWFDMKYPTISIVGLGQVGTALLRVLSEQGLQVISAYNRTEVSDGLKKEFVDTSVTYGDAFPEISLGELVFITVSDDSIVRVADQIADQFEELSSHQFVHCSGTLTSGALATLQEKGASTASFHPMQAITRSTDSFSGIWFDMEGDEKVMNVLERIANMFGSNTFRVSPEAKPYLHASAVVASNYLVVLADLMARISSRGNIPEETVLNALTPLMENTIKNIRELGVTDALTGPIARGDEETVREHLERLKKDPEVLSLYKIFGLEAVRIAERKNGLSEALRTIKKLLL